MLKYSETDIVFEEIPGEVTLAINISGCPCRCPQCHSKHLWNNVGEELSADVLQWLVECNEGITCVCFMGGDAEPDSINMLAEHVRKNFPKIKTGWYSGREKKSDLIYIENFDYIKLGAYIEEMGGLNKPTTNQRLYKVEKGEMHDITKKFWRTKC